MYSFVKFIPEFVDLGLPSGTLWAKCNYGTTKETENGEFFSYDEAKKLPINLPTKEQVVELIENSYVTFAKNDNINDIVIFTSKINGKSLIIPTIILNGFIWTSSINYSDPDFNKPYCFRFAEKVLTLSVVKEEYAKLNVRAVMKL